MRFRFRKVIERLEWTATIEVAYSAKPVEIRRYTDESPVTGGGVQEWAWQVIEIERTTGDDKNVIAVAIVEAALKLEADFEDQVCKWCEQDFARRNSGRDRKGIKQRHTRRIKRSNGNLIHHFEQLAAELADGNSGAKRDAQIILARVSCDGSTALLGQVFRGIIKEWDDEQSEWDKMTEEKQLKCVRARQLHQFEQRASGLADGNSEDEKSARIILARVVSRGSTDILEEVIRGILMEWASGESEFERLKPEWDNILS